MKNEKKSFGEYYLGIDAGTDSVGWAVTDENYNVLKFHGKAMWGVRLFEEAQTAADRRALRTARRRQGRKVQRTKLLQELFAEEICKKDSAFFIRMADSKYYAEDKTEPQQNALFNDVDYTDKDYHKEYPTVYHLRRAFIEGKDIRDPRLLYLAVHHKIVKQECYVFDFALDRALRQISDYSCRLNVAESNPEKKVGEFINFLPVLAYDGSAMRQVNAAEILDIAMAGTSATLLAKRWESALLVNVDNDTLARLLASEEAMDALMRIEGFRSLNADIETIINKSNAVKKAKRDGEKLTPKEKKELTDAEKEYKSKRKMIQEKLIKFATRVPVFMYLTDYREYSLQDVITQLEPELFKKVTGLDVKDFELLVSLNVFNEALMNDAVYKFKRYEDASLIYTGIDKHTGENVGLYSTVISRADYDAMAGQLAASMTADAPRDDDIPERPVFTNISSYDLDDDEDDLPMVAEPKAKYETKRKPLVEPSKPVSTPTYRPSYVPPTPSVTPVVKKPTVHIDTSKVHAGTIVSHKAFGPGQVKGIDGGLIVVTFAGVDKKFQFPGAFEQGFLKLDE